MAATRQRFRLAALTAAGVVALALPAWGVRRDVRATEFNAAFARAAREAEGDTVIAASDGAVSLNGSDVRVSLSPAVKDRHQSFAELINSLGPERRIYLIVRGAHVAQQPGVLFNLYLNVPEGESLMPGKTDPRYIGALNFYEAPGDDDRGEGTRDDDAPYMSFNVTRLVRKLQAQKLLGDQVTVTISPSGTPAPGANPQLSRIELIVR